MDRADARVYRPPDGTPAWLAPGTLVFRKSAWLARRFPETGGCVECEFLARCGPGRVLPLDGERLGFTAATGTASDRGPAGPGWHPAALDEVARLIGTDRPFYAALRFVTPAAAPPAGGRRGHLRLAVLRLRRVRVDGRVPGAGDGPGGAAVNVLPLRMDPAGLSPEFLDLLALVAAGGRGGGTGLLPAVGEPRPAPRGGRTVLNTMWETSRIPTRWAGACSTGPAPWSCRRGSSPGCSATAG